MPYPFGFQTDYAMHIIKMKTKIQFGTILWFDEEKNQGQLTVYGELQTIQFSLNSRRLILAGLIEPEFATTEPKSSIMPQK